MAADFTNTTPAALAGYTNVTFQYDASGNISACLPTSILTEENTSIVSLTAGDVLVWNGSEWVNSFLPGGSEGDIQYNNGFGGFDGSSATIDAAGNLVDTTGSFKFGKFSSLPAYLQSLIYPGLNSVNYVIPAVPGGGIFGLAEFGAYCSDPDTYILGFSGSVASPTGSYAIYLQSAITSGSSGGVGVGLSVDAFVEDATVTDAYVYGGFVGTWNNGGNVAISAALDLAVGQTIPGRGTGGAGIQQGIGVLVEGVFADLSTGQAIGYYIEPESGSTYGISGATRYALKFDTSAPSAFKGVIGWQNSGLTTIPTGFSQLAAGSVALGNGAQGNASGSLSLTNTLLQPITPPTSAATAGTKGQVVFGTDGNLYVCTVTGAATHATWTKATLTAV
jgi:hypothetical protein